MSKNMLMLHLSCVLGAIIIYLISTIIFSLDILITTTIATLFLFYMAFYQTFLSLGIVDKIIKQSVNEDLEKNMVEYLKEIKQAERKWEFQSAFETDEEREIREKESNELEVYNKNYEVAKGTFKDKKKLDMNDFEKVHYYRWKMDLLIKYSKLPIITLMFILGFLTMFTEYLSFKVVISITLALAAIILPLYIYNLVLYHKMQRTSKSIEPDSVKKLLRDFGIE